MPLQASPKMKPRLESDFPMILPTPNKGTTRWKSIRGALVWYAPPLVEVWDNYTPRYFYRITQCS